MASANLTEANTALVFKMPLRVGAIDPSDTDWLQSPIGGNNVINTALVMACVDVDPTAASTATVLDFDDANTPTSVSDNINPTAIVAVLSIENLDGGNELPTLVRGDGADIKFTSAAGTAGDTHRITFIYR